MEVLFNMANLVLKNNTSGGKTSVTADNFVGNASSASKYTQDKYFLKCKRRLYYG
jgi:hypothetical protein